MQKRYIMAGSDTKAKAYTVSTQRDSRIERTRKK